MSEPYPQQPAGQPAAPAVPGAAAQPVQPAPQVVSQAGAPAQPTAPAQPAPQGVPQGYSVAPQGVPQMGPAQAAPQGVPQVGVPAQPAPQGYSAAPQGYAPGYAPVPQGPVKVRINYLSLVFGIGVWVFIALLVLDAWVEMHSPDASASGNDIFGFFPLFVLGFCGPLNLVGAIVASSRAKEKPAKWKLNRLGMILNLSPYVIFFVIMFVGMIVEAFLS